MQKTISPRGLSFTRVIESGFNPAEYNPEFTRDEILQLYEASKIPIGKWVGTLDFVMWGKTPVLHCFFSAKTILGSEYAARDGEKFRLSAFKDERIDPQAYTPRDKKIDFSNHIDMGGMYELETRLNTKKKPAWISARVLMSDNIFTDEVTKNDRI